MNKGDELDLFTDQEFQNLSLELKTKLVFHYPNIILKLKDPDFPLIKLALDSNIYLVNHINHQLFLNNEDLIKLVFSKVIEGSYELKDIFFKTSIFDGFLNIFEKKIFSQEIQDLYISTFREFLNYHLIVKISKNFSQKTLMSILKFNNNLFEGMDYADYSTSEYAILTNPEHVVQISNNNVLTPVEKIRLYLIGLKKDPHVVESISIIDSTDAHDAILKLENKLRLLELMDGKSNE